MTFNIHGGYLEAIVRGHISGLLTASDYNNLCQCETLDDIKMHLSATEYGPYLQNVWHGASFVWHDRAKIFEHKPEQFRLRANKISLVWESRCDGFDPVDCHDYHSHGYHVISCVDYIPHLLSNTVEDRIMDSGALFHVTYCKEELKRFKLRSGKARLADDKTLDITGIGDVILKTSYGTSWTLKDVRDQQWKVTKASLVVAHGNKRGSLYMVEVHPEGINAIINGSGSAAICFGKVEESFLYNVNEDKETAEQELRIVMLKMVPETPLQFGVAKRLSQTFRAESTGICAEAMLWADSVSRGSDEMQHSFRDTKSHQVIQSRDIIFVDSIYEAMSATDSSSLTKPIQKIQVVLVDIPKNLVENHSIVVEHGLSLEITQSLGRSSDTSEGSKNSGSFENNGRSDEEYSKDKASCKERGSKTPHVQRSTRESRAPIRYSPSAKY
ncbi:retrovirus-related pol polyprotein from transposon TNT 1-94 [Tanacetum coccineum]